MREEKRGSGEERLRRKTMIRIGRDSICPT
jgi:hypothetical protein